MITQDETGNTGLANQFVEIKEVTHDIYNLIVKLVDHTTIKTMCRVTKEKSSGGDVVEAIHFDSEEFQRKIMMGEVQLKAIRDAIFEFRNPLVKNNKSSL